MPRKKKEETKINNEESILAKVKELAPKEVAEKPESDYVSSYVEPEERNALKVGDWISLNPRNSACFGIEQNGTKVIWLSRKNRSVQIPAGLSKESMVDLYAAILAGHIVKGNVHILKEDQNPDIVDDFVKLLNSGSVTDLPEAVKKTLKDSARKQKISGVLTVRVFSEMYAYEASNRKRPKVLDYLNALIDFSSKFHNVHYEAEKLEEDTQVILNATELQKIQAASVKEVTQKAGLSAKRVGASVDDFANAYKAL